MSRIYPDTLMLKNIEGISPFNIRPDVDYDDALELVPSLQACSLLQPLLVQFEHGVWRVLDGGRRWLALKIIDEQQPITEAISVLVFEGTEAESREASLAAALGHKPAHPVREFEAFCNLHLAGFDVPRIAKDFGVEPNHIKKRLALGRLSPKVRAAWRDGEISEALAQAFSASDDHAAQDALLAQGVKTLSPVAIRHQLRGDVIAAHLRFCLFVGEAAYVEAGGRVEEDLFESMSLWLDGALARRLSDEKIAATIARVQAEDGWAWGRQAEDLHSPDYEIGAFSVDYLPAELDRLEQIEDSEHPDDIAEAIALNHKAVLRGCPKSLRASLGFSVSLTVDGNLYFQFGLRKRITSALSAPDVDGAPTPKPAAAPAPVVELPTGLIPPKALLVLNAALNTAMAEVIARRPELALALVLATIAKKSYELGPFKPERGTFGQDDACASHLLQDIAGLEFDTILKRCFEAPNVDVLNALSEGVGGRLRFGEARPGYDNALITLVGERADLHGALIRAFDYPAYIACLDKRACLDIIGICNGDTAAKSAATMKKAEMTTLATAAAKRTSWLPERIERLLLVLEPLTEQSETADLSTSDADPHHTDTRTTAQAMQDALEQDALADDETSDSPNPVLDDAQAAVAAEPDASNSDMPLALQIFLQPLRHAESRVDGCELFAAYCVLSDAASAPYLTFTEFSRAIASAGFAKHRTKNGVFYIGLTLPVSRPEAAE